MKIHVITFSIVSSLFLLTGCGSSTTTVENPLPSTATGEVRRLTGVTLCDNYLASLQCIADASTGIDKINFNSTYSSLLQGFTNIPASQAEETCLTLSNALRSHPTLLQDHKDCNKL